MAAFSPIVLTAPELEDDDFSTQALSHYLCFHFGPAQERAPELRDQVVQLAFERGLLVLGAGDNTIRLCPPLVVTVDQCEFALDTLEECLKMATANG